MGQGLFFIASASSVAGAVAVAVAVAVVDAAVTVNDDDDDDDDEGTLEKAAGGGDRGGWDAFDGLMVVGADGGCAVVRGTDEEEEVVTWLLAPFAEDDRRYLTAYVPGRGREAGRPRHKTLDAGLLEIADDIAYGTHDLEDGIALGLIRPDVLREGEPSCAAILRSPWGRRHGLAAFADTVFDPARRKTSVGALVNALVTSVRIETVEPSLHPLVGTEVRLDPEAEVLLERLKGVVQRHMIDIPQVRTIRFRAQQMVIALFSAYLSDPVHLMPREFAERVEQGEAAWRVVADYVSGMTDAYATRAYARLYLPREDPAFERM